MCDRDDLDWARLADAARRPSRLNRAVVEDLELITGRQRRMYHELSSAEMIVHVQAQAGLLVALLDSAAPDALRRRVASAAAEAAGFAAWLWYDLGDLSTMNHCYRQAVLAVTNRPTLLYGPTSWAIRVLSRGYRAARSRR